VLPLMRCSLGSSHVLFILQYLNYGKGYVVTKSDSVKNVGFRKPVTTFGPWVYLVSKNLNI